MSGQVSQYEVSGTTTKRFPQGLIVMVLAALGLIALAAATVIIQNRSVDSGAGSGAAVPVLQSEFSEGNMPLVREYQFDGTVGSSAPVTGSGASTYSEADKPLVREYERTAAGAAVERANGARSEAFSTQQYWDLAGASNSSVVATPAEQPTYFTEQYWKLAARIQAEANGRREWTPRFWEHGR